MKTPSKQELPLLQGIWNDFGGRTNFAMFVIGREESDETVHSFKSKEGFTFPMASDPNRSIYGKFASQRIPRTYLISRDGTILYQSTGFYVEEIAKPRQIVERKLKTQS